MLEEYYHSDKRKDRKHKETTTKYEYQTERHADKQTDRRPKNEIARLKGSPEITAHGGLGLYKNLQSINQSCEKRENGCCPWERVLNVYQ